MGEDRIEVGAIIVLRGTQYSIAEELSDGRFRLESLDGNAGPMAVPREQLEKAYIDGLLEFPIAAWMVELNEKSPGVKLAQDIAQLPESFQRETRRRAAYVRAVDKLPERRWDRRYLGHVLSEVSEKLADGGPPSVSTVRRWHERYVEADKDVRALIPRIKGRGSRRRRFDPLVVKIIDAMIDRYYLNRTRKTVEEVQKHIAGAISRANEKRDPADQLALPSVRAVYAEVAKIDPYHVCERRFGKRFADRKFAQTGQGIHATRPLERIEVDHTKADLMVVDDETRMPLGRPWITVLIDKYSRMIYGIYIGFTPSSYLSVMHALRHGLLPKADLKEKFPEIENDWPIYGKPEVLVCDNGPEFLSKSFEETLNDLGIELELNDAGSPQQKGVVERFLGQLNRGLLQGQPGTTFSNYFERKDYDPAKNAVIPLSLLKRLIYRYICDYYHMRYHRGLGGQPMAVYLDAAKKYPPPALPRSAKELTPLLCKMSEKSIHHYGIEILGLKFNRPELAAIQHRLGRQKAKVRINEENLAEIYVWDEFEQRYLTVPCTAPEYANGLSLWQHKVVRRNTITKGMNPVDTADLARVRLEIQETVEAWWHRNSKTGHRQKAARWLNVGKEYDLAFSKPPKRTPEPALTDDSESARFESLDDEDQLMNQLLNQGWGIDPQSVNHQGDRV